MRNLILCVVVSCLATSGLVAGEKELMHCFAFTALENATNDDWQGFFRATDQIPHKIKGVTRVWYGKLASPLTQTVRAQSGDVTRIQRQWGVCMEMDNEAVRKAYGSDPYHAQWEAAYEKVRVPGTTTFDILGQ
jgi:hypothetical protein